LESGSPEGLALRRLARRLSNRYFSYPSMAQYGSKFYWCIPCRPSPPFSGLGGSLQGLEKMVGFAAVSLIGRLANVPISVIASLVMANRALPLLPIPFQFEGGLATDQAGIAGFPVDWRHYASTPSPMLFWLEQSLVTVKPGSIAELRKFKERSKVSPVR
jgi:hypothetical protein